MIKNKEFKKLCNISSKILKARPNLSNLGNPFLFLVSGHSFFLSRYESINSEKTSILFLLKNFFLIKINLLKLLLFTFKIIFSKNINTIKNNFNYDFIILSHLINKQNFEKKVDTQFGGIEKRVNKKKTIFFYLNHIGLNHINKNTFFNNRRNLFVNNDCIDLKTYKKIIIDIFREIPFFYKKIKKTSNNFERKFNILSCKYLLSISTVKNMILFYNLEKLILEKKIKSIILTLEGHPYEFLAYLLKKKHNIEVNGYQHSLITKSHFSMFMNLDKDLNPNKIFTNGQISYDFLKKKFEKKKVFILGSYKYRKKNKFKKQKNLSCLLLPTGLESESLELLNLSKGFLHKNMMDTDTLENIIK